MIDRVIKVLEISRGCRAFDRGGGVAVAWLVTAVACM